MPGARAVFGLSRDIPTDWPVAQVFLAIAQSTGPRPHHLSSASKFRRARARPVISSGLVEQSGFTPSARLFRALFWRSGSRSPCSGRTLFNALLRSLFFIPCPRAAGSASPRYFSLFFCRASGCSTITSRCSASPASVGSAIPTSRSPRSSASRSGKMPVTTCCFSRRSAGDPWRSLRDRADRGRFALAAPALRHASLICTIRSPSSS